MSKSQVKNKKRVSVPKQKIQEEETAIVKLQNELKETQQSSVTIVNPVTSIISNPELYFSFMEIATLDMFAKKKSLEALKIMSTLFTQYQEFLSKKSDSFEGIDAIFAESHKKEKEE